VTRIISGAFGGRRIDVPAGAGTRPTSDRVREALFARLDHQDALARARVLDLYAGSGALGLESLSRGAAFATFVESDRSAVDVLRRNVRSLLSSDNQADEVVQVLAEPVQKVLLRGPSGVAYDLVVADPPYGLVEEDLADVLALLPRNGWLAADALVVVERSARSPEPRWPADLAAVDERRYGETRVWFARAAGDPDAA
jgi:16S rRNA (guanine966-N2)-methyltransferase